MPADPLTALLALPEEVNQQRKAATTQRALAESFAPNLPPQVLEAIGPREYSPLGGSGVLGKILSGVGKVGAVLSAASGTPLTPAPRIDLGSISNFANIGEQKDKRLNLQLGSDAMAAGDMKTAARYFARAGATNLLSATMQTAKPAGGRVGMRFFQYQQQGMSPAEAAKAAADDEDTKDAKRAAEVEGRWWKQFNAQNAEWERRHDQERADSNERLKPYGLAIVNGQVVQAGEQAGPPAPGAQPGTPGAPATQFKRTIAVDAKGEPKVTWTEVPNKPSGATNRGSIQTSAAGAVSAQLGAIRDAVVNGVGSDGSPLLPPASELPMANTGQSGVGAIVRRGVQSASLYANQNRVQNEAENGNPAAVALTSMDGLTASMAKAFGDSGNISDATEKRLKAAFSTQGMSQDRAAATVDRLQDMLEAVLEQLVNNPAAVAKDPNKVDRQAALDELNALRASRQQNQGQGGQDVGDGFSLH